MIDVYVDVDDSFTAAEAWSPNVTYNPGNRVYDNSGQSTNTFSPIYVCIKTNSNTTFNPAPTHWVLAGTSPEYPLLTKDPMEVVEVNRDNPFDYEWSFDGTNLDLSEASNPIVMRHYRMIEEAGGGRVIFMFETYDSPHTSKNSNQAMLKIIPGPILSDTTKITFDSYGKNTTIIYNSYGNHPHNGASYGLSAAKTESLTDPRANNYYFNNLTFKSEETFAGLFAIAAGEFRGCKFIKTITSSQRGGHRFFVATNGSTIKAKFISCLFEQSYGIGVAGNSSATEFIGCTFVYNNFDSVKSYAKTSVSDLFPSTLKTFENNIFYIKKIPDFNSSQIYEDKQKVMFSGKIYYSSGVYTPNVSKPPNDPTSNWATFNTNLQKAWMSNNVFYIEGYESDSNYLGVTYQDPMFVDPGSSNYRLRPSSPLIGGVNHNQVDNTQKLYVTPSNASGPNSDYIFGGNTYSLPDFEQWTPNGQGNNRDPDYLLGMRVSYGGEIYECIENHDALNGQEPPSDATNWRLVQGTIDDPYKTSDFGDSTINDKLTSDHELILLDGDYNYFPLTSDSSYPTTSPVLRALNRHKAIIYGTASASSKVRPAGFIAKDLVFENSLAQYGHRDYPINGRVGFHLENCIIHSEGPWWPPINCVVSRCLIFSNLTGKGMFWGSFGQSDSPLPTDKAITFIHNTVVFSGAADVMHSGPTSVLTSLINQGNYNATFKNNIFYVKSGFDPGPYTNFSHNSFNNSALVSEDNIVFDENGILVDNITKGMTYIDPKLIDTSSNEYGSYRLRPDSPLIGGISKSKYPANSVWIDSTSGTGTGTEDDPFTLSQFNDAIDLAVTNETFELIHKDGTYTWTNAGGQMRHPNLGLVTLVAENFQKATITSHPGRVDIQGLTSQTLKMKDMVLFAKDHFIGNQNCHLIFDNCYVNSDTYIYPSTNGSFNFKNCIFEKRLGSDMHIMSTAPGLFVNCLFIDRNLNSTTRFDDTALGRTFKNCIFRGEQTSNPSSAIHGNGNLINCAFYNYNSDGYSDEEVIFNGDPLMINFDSTSHENSNYALRPNSPLIGKGK